MGKNDQDGEVGAGLMVSFLPHGNLFRQRGIGRTPKELGIVGRNHWVLRLGADEERQLNTLMDEDELKKFKTEKAVGEEPDERFNKF